MLKIDNQFYLSNQKLFVEGTNTRQEEDLEAKAMLMEEQRQQKIKRLNESAKLNGAFKYTVNKLKGTQ